MCTDVERSQRSYVTLKYKRLMLVVESAIYLAADALTVRGKTETRALSGHCGDTAGKGFLSTLRFIEVRPGLSLHTAGRTAHGEDVPIPAGLLR